MNGDKPKNKSSKRGRGQSLDKPDDDSLNKSANKKKDDSCQLLSKPDLNDVSN